MNEGRILVVDDEKSMCELIEAALQMRGFETVSSQSASDAMGRFRESEFDVVLTDVRMPGESGLQLCQQLCSLRPDVPVVVMTAFGSMETAVAAIRSGAYDFITKPVEMEVLAIALARAVEKRRLSNQIRLLKQAAEGRNTADELLGESEPMKRLTDQLIRVSPTGTSILITGESGTGKELVARSIHQRSPRAKRPFVAVNCAALSESLLESELFGHAKGAFTDARSERRGLFLEAEGGTLLLDEIGDMPMAMQVKLLRTLEENRLRPVGGDREIEFDVRVLAATHRDLELAVEEGRFRQDLFYRINVIQLHLPALRARGVDILKLAIHFVDRFAKHANKPISGIAEPAAEKLLSYAWPGNVRELRNVIERAVALTRYNTITLEDLPEKIRDYKSKTVFIGGDDPTELVSLEQVESRYVEHVLDAVNQNRTLAAQVLGIDRKTLYRKLKD
ncbi:Transcriptional regulatory protein ZraR [Novipirellula aureliae]|uniref:Transcriptional regulatory protein ZraR n=1 Tax=Novipirellula aureliae TaxID=2527966 RepID=A0A5C6DQ12_9BACT|nr:sigma-54 dependent transcriptional regulator [Novipirellula aureliae]TWU38910.1 Transcriptional regulatory protein ZraR [Novipirellula aureliae]